MAVIGNIYQLRQQLHKNKLDVVFDYLEASLNKNTAVSKRIKDYEIGAFERVDIVGQEIFALEQVFMTKSRENCFFESHLKYIDFQLILEEWFKINKQDPNSVSETPFLEHAEV